MATRNIEAIEHKGRVYVSLEGLQSYLVSLADRAEGVSGKEGLQHVLYQLAMIRDRRPA